MKFSSALLVLLLAISAGALAQKSSLQTARDLLSEQKYKEALPLLDAAIRNEETKADADAWYLRGMAQLQEAMDTVSGTTMSAYAAYLSFKKVLELKPDYGPEINSPLYSAAVIKFNRGVERYTMQQYNNASTEFISVGSMYQTAGNRADEAFKKLDLSARTNGAYAAMNGKLYSEAITLLEPLVKNESKDDPQFWQALIQCYAAEKNDVKQLATIKAGQAKFPTDEAFRNMELNYYINKGDQAALMPKLEAAIAKEPNNPDLLFNMGNIYARLAYPTTAKGNFAARPANFSTLYAKSESMYKKAIQLAPAAADYHYNLGILYYTQVRWYITRSRDKDVDDKLRKELTDGQDKEIRKSQPHFEQSYKLLNSKSDKLTEDEKVTYVNSMTALKEVYARIGEPAKQAEMEAAIERAR